MPQTDARRKRCAIYTRKSSEEGLEQEFNSLAAQREACEAYIRSQRNEGWVLARTRYEDGGFSGGNMERPALQCLLADIRAGRIEIVVVYKVDRLTRSLADFARLVEIFDAQGASFVSVTQQFNTTSSMGRLTLNVLLSFAQFEREVTGERIRDKIAASKKKGMWMGGMCRSAMTRASAPSSSTLPRPRPCAVSSLSIESSAACAGSKKKPTAWGCGQNAARRRMTRSAAANPSRAGISMACSQTRSTPGRLRTRVSSTPACIRR
jgi:DNA invertase Pin-like site-specific DNA recombinase